MSSANQKKKRSISVKRTKKKKKQEKAWGGAGRKEMIRVRGSEKYLPTPA